MPLYVFTNIIKAYEPRTQETTHKAQKGFELDIGLITW